MERESKKRETAAVAAIQSKRVHKQRIATAQPARQPEEAVLRPTRDAREVGHPSLRTNGIPSISLKTIRVATLHPSLNKGAESAIAAPQLTKKLWWICRLSQKPQVQIIHFPADILEPSSQAGISAGRFSRPSLFAVIYREGRATS